MASDSQQAYGSPPPQSVAWGPYTQPQPQPQAQPQPPPQLQPQLQPEIPRHDELANESEVTESKDNNQSEGDSGQDENDNDADRKRKRPMSVSCELCKQRKVKCDRVQPMCGWCSRNGYACEYKERKKPGLRAGYGRELESRLDRLESVLQQQQILLSQIAGMNLQASTAQASSNQEANVFAAPAAFPLPNPTREDQSTPSQRASIYTPQVTSNPGLGEDFANLPAGYLQQPSPDSHRQSHSMVTPNKAAYYAAANASSGKRSTSMADALVSSVANDHDFPPYDLLYALADLYFKHINTWCSILHRKTTLDTLFGGSSLDEDDRILLHAIVATTLRFSTDARLDAEKKDRYYTISKQKVLLYGFQHSSVKALQALVILALDLCGASNRPPGWNLLALITRSAVQLGLSVETTSQTVAPRLPSIYTLRAMVLPESRTWIEDESRRRLFWMVYILDRYATITTAFDFALDEKEIDRRLPCRDDLFAKNQPVETRWFRHLERAEKGIDKPENLGSFSYYVEIVAILSRIHHFLKKPIDIGSLDDVEQWQTEYRELDSMLHTWKLNLPREYSNTARLFESTAATTNKVANCGWVMLHATYHTTVIRLHSSAAYPTHRSPIFAPSFSASQRCLTAVESISALCHHVKNNLMLNKLGPPFAFSVWVAARLLVVHSSTVDLQMNPIVHFFVGILHELGLYWAVADRYAALLQRVLDEFADSERAPITSPSGERVVPSCVRILADMRRCAYDLDVLISQQPNSQSVEQTTRNPAPNELEYLDVFDFFNMPRLPVNADGVGGGGTESNTNIASNIVPSTSQQGNGPARPFGSEFNITNFSYDANADWFGKS